MRHGRWHAHQHRPQGIGRSKSSGGGSSRRHKIGHLSAPQGNSVGSKNFPSAAVPSIQNSAPSNTPTLTPITAPTMPYRPPCLIDLCIQVTVTQTPGNPERLGYNLPLIRDGSKTVFRYPLHCFQHNTLEAYLEDSFTSFLISLELISRPER